MEFWLSSRYVNAIAPMKIIRQAFDLYDFALSLESRFDYYSPKLMAKALSFMDSYITNMRIALNDLKKLNECAEAFAVSCVNFKSKQEYLKHYLEKIDYIFDAEKSLENQDMRIKT